MSILNKLNSLFKFKKKEEQISEIELNIEKIAQHEAAHGIVWYLFRHNWKINQLTIENINLPDKGMNGALHITANFNPDEENNIERANELFAIALAGLIGQNINLIKQRENLLSEIIHIGDFNQIFDTSGCGDDFKIAKEYLPHLGKEFKVSEASFTKYKIMDLVSLFQDDYKVQLLHTKLIELLIEKRTLTSEQLICFFEEHSFSEYIVEEGLDINFFHKR